MELIRPVFAFELGRLVRQPAFAASLVAMAGAAAMIVGTGFGPSGVHLNGPYVVVQAFGLLTLVATFVLTFFVAHAALADAEHRVHELLFATPLTPTAWFAGRCGAVVAAGALTMLAAAVTLLAAPHLMAVDPERVGSIRIGPYVWSLVVMVIPNLVLIAAMLFAVAAITGSSAATAVAGIGIWGLFWVTALLVDSPLLAGTAPPSADALARAAVLDPFGLSAFFEQTRYWTPAERNERLPTLTGRMLINRVLWLGVSAGLLMMAARLHARRLTSPSRRSATSDADVVQVGQAESAATAARTDRPVPLGGWDAWRLLTRYEVRRVVRSWPFAALLVMWLMIAGIEIMSELSSGEYGARLLPTTALVVDRLLQPLQLFGALVLIHFAGEIVWRDRQRGMHVLTDATPAPAPARLGAQLAALLALPLLLLASGLLVGVGIQIAVGHAEWRPGVLLGTVGYAGLPLLVLGIGVFVLQVIIPNRWVAMLAGIVLALAGAGQLPGVEHPLVRYGAFPLAGYSDFDGFGAAPRSFLAFGAWWGSVALGLCVVAWALPPFGADLALRRRVRRARQSLGAHGQRLGIAALVLCVGVGAWLAAEIARTTRFPDRRAMLAWRADYEREYRRFHERPHPSAEQVALVVSLEPDERRARVEGSLLLVNRQAASVDTILVGLPRDARAASLVVETGTVLLEDHARRVTRVVPRAPLQPGDSLRLRFTHEIDRGGVHAEVPPRDITGNGTVLSHGQLLPTIGYRPQQEIDDAAERVSVGLTGGATPRPRAEEVQGPLAADAWMMMDVTVGTEPDQTALAVGELVGQWDSAGRRWYRWRTSRPVTPAMAIVSARLDRHVVRGRDVTVEVWHHPAHAVNVARIGAAMLTSADELGARFGPLPDSVLRVVELPRWSGFGAYALTGLILFPEHRGFLLDARPDRIDLLQRRLAHEVGHMWWGHRLAPPEAEGARVLVESLAKDAEQLVTRRVHGRAEVDAILAYDEDRYLVGRADAGTDEPPLVRMTDQSWLDYGKGSLMLHALRAELGDSAVDAALRQLLAEQGGPAGAPTVLGLRTALLARANSPADTVSVRAWFDERSVWDVAVDTVHATATAWRVVVRGTHQADATQQMRSEGGAGALTVVTRDAEGRDRWSGVVSLRGGAGVIEVPRAAGGVEVVVDPDRRVIDRDRENNRRRLPALRESRVR